MNARELDRLQELTSIGAGHAATAFSQLTGRPFWMGVPCIAKGEEGALAPQLRAGDVWSTGVFFELEGCLDAVLGLLFHAEASEAVVRRVVGIDEGEVAPTWIESALMEVGNIVASHVASAIADTLGERLLPSIPSLAMNQAEQALAQLLLDGPGIDALRIECQLIGDDGCLGGLLVLVPTSPSGGTPQP
jgi:chemotaxis protein CheC